MILDTAQSMAFIIVGILLVIVLLRVLFAVHHQAKKVKDLEMRMKAVEKMEQFEAEKETEK